MAWWPDLARRDLQPEIMDRPELDPALHRQALAGLRRLNWASGSAGILWPAIHPLAKRKGLRALSVLDVACGGGDVALDLWRRARRRNIELHITGCDVSSVALDTARAQASEQGVDAQWLQLDALTQPLPGEFDVVMSSLFLHHLADNDAARLLAKMAGSAGHLLLVNDLRRSRAGYLLAQLACRVLTRSPVVHFDGPQSVAAAFTLPEVAVLCRQAKLERAQVRRRWPCRFLLSWQRDM
jgi:2-polyprenyl-3-methyl-5-hydroxy-6-metoxy-1,4-benzoquinol methylase